MTYLAWGAKRLPLTLLWPFTFLGGGLLLPSCLEREPVPAQPKTSNVLVRPIASRAVDKVDLLFVIDNSGSMADKQKILKDAVPRMIERLVLPDCVERDSEGMVIQRTRATRPSASSDLPSCEGDSVLEFTPVRDLHVGVITSSLGDRGTGACPSNSGNDGAHLLPRTARSGVPDPHGTGFLVYRPVDPGEAGGLPVEHDFARFQEDLAEQIGLVGEDGCGFESPLEAAYRFLVDPNPPAEVRVDAVAKSTVSEGVDQELLDQRAAFLRPDSLLGVVILTDENDCSLSSGEPPFPNSRTSHSLMRSGVLPVATRACALNPNDPCCTSCQATKIPEGCQDPSALDVCTGQGQPEHVAENDRSNLRCFAGKRRFGLDLLYPVSRYIEGFSSPEILDARSGTYVDNPLFGPGRDKSLVYLAGIVGVPWQDLATSETLATPDTLRLKSATALHAADISTPSGNLSAFDLMIGRPGKNPEQPECRKGTSPECGQAPIAPYDPFMVESIEEREGVHPVLGISLNSEEARAINGHEYDVNAPSERFKGEPARDDLQYACIFPLAPYGELPACTDENCDCYSDLNQEKPLCQANSSAPYEAVQHFAKAYPGTRVLEVLSGLGDSAIVASICPKVHDPTKDDFGYNPALTALVDRLAVVLDTPCLSRELSVSETTDQADCVVVEALSAPSSCDLPGRKEVDAELSEVIFGKLRALGSCTEDCSGLKLCQVDQLRDAEREACETAPLGTETRLTPGYCYVSPEEGRGAAHVVASCPDSQKRKLRFVGEDTPRKGSTTILACLGEPL